MNYKERLNNLIPGGAHTYSRGHDQFPANAPEILERGHGCHVWDPEGNKFIDYGMGLRSVAVGYAYEPVADAAILQIRNGNNLTRPSLIELKAAETLTALIPGADMVKFAKNGSTVTTAALKLARAHTGRPHVAVCAEHPFFSFDDWFIRTTPVSKGIPDESGALTLRFHYNDLASLRLVFDQHPNKVAAVMLEPATTEPPKDGFLQGVKALCDQHGALLILDEMITGFRWDLRGAQTYFGVRPHMATFGKAMANGFSVAALVGPRELMSLGGITPDGAERTFLISTTHGAEMAGLGAFVRTVEAYRELDVVGHLWKYGAELMAGMNAIAKSLGIQEFFQLNGFPCSPAYSTKDATGRVSLGFRTLFSQEMIKQGVLMPWVALSYSHGPTELELTLKAAEGALKVYADALEGGLARHLEGPEIRPVFRKRN